MLTWAICFRYIGGPSPEPPDRRLPDSYYRLVLADPSTRLQGYVLTGTFESPEALVLNLREPPGQTPIRIRLLGPWTLMEPIDVPPDGVIISRTEWHSEPGSSESLTIHFGDGRSLVATCKQVALDVF